MGPRVDVGRLAVRRDRRSQAAIRPRRHLFSRYLLPGLLALSMAALVTWAGRDALVPARDVTVTPVVVRRAAVREEGAALFTAAGWVEPRPTPLLVTALAEGVVEKLTVVEGQEVKAGEPVAYLIDVDARLAVDDAEAEVSICEAELSRAVAELAAARANVQQPVHLEAALAEAESLLAEVDTQLAELPFQIEAAAARLRLAEHELERKSNAGEAVPGREIQRARSERDAAAAEASRLSARKPHLAAQSQALRRQCDALRKRLELRTAETRALAEAESHKKAAEAALDRARVAARAAQLRLERMIVRAPAAGRVLELVAAPGARVSGAGGHSGQDRSVVVTLYDPQMLQVRADVRLEDLPHVSAGQAVRIRTAALDRPLQGEVLTATSAADVQKNTLEVKLAVTDPPPLLKPEMLVEVTFLAPKPAQPEPEAETEADVPLRVYVPSRLLSRSDEEAFLWVADQAAGIARRRAVKVGPAAGELIEIADGLDPSSRLIVGGRDGLRDGQKIRIAGEDETLGSADGRSIVDQ